MDTIILDASANPAAVTKIGDTTGPLAAGKHLRVETSPDGDELLDYTVPAGKVASVRVSVSIVETDA